jgi:VWFA-related protein
MALFVNAKGLHLIQGFTTDHALLKQAFLRKGPPPSVPDLFIYGESFGRYDVGAALSNLNFMAEYLAGLPDRKNLIWLSSNFPIPVGPTVVGLDTTKASSAPQLYSVGGQGGPATLDLSELESDAIKHTFASMMRSRVALYPVSLAGVTGGGDAIVQQGYLDAIASSTGGHAYYSDNKPEKLIDAAIEHGSNYYTLTYAPQNTNFDGSERKIRVSMADPSKTYSLTYRTVYYALSDDEEQKTHKGDEVQKRFLAAKQQDTLYATTEHGAPMMHDVLFVAHMTAAGKPQMATEEQMRQLQDSPVYFKTRKKNQNPKPPAPVKLQKYIVDYDVVDPRLRAMTIRGQKPIVLEFATAAYNNDGTLLNSILNEGALTSERNVNGKEQNHFHAEQELHVPLSAVFIRVVVRSKADDRTGALEIRLPLTQPAETAKLSPAP